MAKLYYGNGICSINGEGFDIRGVQIGYVGNIKLEKKTNDSFVIIHNNSKILIYPVGEGLLTDLFLYTGTIRITSIIVAGHGGERVDCTVKQVMDYAELIESNAEDMTTLSQNLNSTYKKGRKTINEYDGIIKDQYSDGKLYLKDGTIYTGDFHIHTKDSNSCMTGCEHMEDSQDLYFKQIDDNGRVINRLIPTKNPSGILPASTLDKRRVRKVKWKIKTKEDGHVPERKEPTRKLYTSKTTRKGGMGGSGGSGGSGGGGY